MENNQQVLSQFLDFFQTTNKQNFFIRVGSIFALIISVFLYNQQDALVNVWRETRLENVHEKIKEQRLKEFPIIAKEQVQIQYSVVKQDLVAIYEYKPIGKNNFADLIEYEGKLRENLDVNSLRNLPVNKSQKEYQDHLTGRNYDGNEQQRSILFNGDYSVKRIYSCPIYNLDNVYYSKLVFIWYNEESKMPDEDDLEAQCLSQSRILGRAK